MCRWSVPCGVKEAALPESGRAGKLVLVVGPSGAGKDTLIRYAQVALAGRPDIHFVQRVITRPADPALEDHLSATEAQFAAMLAEGRFALHWTAHGLRYGVPLAIEDALRNGAIVVVNASRSIVAEAKARYADVLTVYITAPRSVLIERLAARGRESAAEIERRIGRTEPDGMDREVVRIQNDAPIDRAGDALVSVILGKHGKANGLAQSGPRLR